MSEAQTNTESEKTRKTRQLNDLFRNTMLSPFGNVLLTLEVQQLTERSRRELLNKVRSFTAFEEGDDPYHEHDFGAVDHEGKAYFFKIDYYERGSNFERGSEDPSNTHDTERVLTIMAASEY